MLAQDSLADRYGHTPAWRRPLLIGASAVLIVTFVAWLAWVIGDTSTPDVESELVGFTVEGTHSVQIEVAIELADEDVLATCTAQAYAEDHNAVGDLSFVPGASQVSDGKTIELAIRTDRRATSVTVGCTTEEQSRPR